LGTIDYPAGRIELDDAKREMEATYVRSFLFRKKNSSIFKLSYDAQTKVSLCKGELTVGDLTVRVSDKSALAELVRFIMAPREEAASRAEKALNLTLEEAGRFLAKRSEALSTLQRLEANPRDVMIASTSIIPDDAEDPVSFLLQALSGEVATAFGKLKESFSTTEASMSAQAVQKAYALVYAVGLYQDWLRFEDDKKRDQAISLMRALGAVVPVPAQNFASAAVAGWGEEIFSIGVKALISSLREPGAIESSQLS
jgi:hypothetical protein